MLLLVTDIDGTISFGENQIPESIEKSLIEFQKEGNILMIATGRNLSQAQVLLKKAKVKFDYIALCNGAVLYDNIHKKVILSHKIEEDYSEIINLFDNSYRVDTLDKTYATKKYNKTKILSFMNRVKLKKASYSRVEFFPIETLDKEEAIYTISSKAKNEEHLKKLVDSLNEFKDKFEILVNNSDIDIQVAKTDKSNAIKYIQNKYEINDENVYPIGDSLNDFLMVKNYPNSATFEYGNNKLKENAKYIVKDVSEYIDKIKNN